MRFEVTTLPVADLDHCASDHIGSHGYGYTA